MSAKKTAEPTFEQMLHRLETIVEQLDRGDVALDDALRIYEEGIAIARTCGEKLAKAELTLKKLAKDVEGNLKLFAMDQDE
jgi:exodeoxyribonuclease VII small subunit